MAKHILSCSFGKDSIATALLALQHGEPLDELVYCEVMFSEEISGELPEHNRFIHETAIPYFEQRGINKEIRHYQEEIFLGLNLRQMICSGAAIAVAVAVYLGLTPLLGHETAGWVCIVAAAPIAAAGFFTYDCLTFEKFLLVVIDSTVIRNDWRLWKTENKYCKKKKGDKH